MQGGPAPADARDPNAYSDGYQRGEGPYVSPALGRLHLMDQHAFWNLRMRRLERAWVRNGDDVAAFDAQGRWGTDLNALVVKAEGEAGAWRLHEASAEVLWGRAIAPYLRYNLLLGFCVEKEHRSLDAVFEAAEARSTVEARLRGALCERG